MTGIRMCFSGAAITICMLLASPAWAADSDDGTVTLNGKVWLKDAGCLGWVSWYEATQRAAALANGQCGLKDNSMPGAWRLPTILELKEASGSQSLFSNVQDARYWTSETYAPTGGGHAWIVGMGSTDAGYVNWFQKSITSQAWAVRKR